jgi:hypothetical protein
MLLFIFNLFYLVIGLNAILLFKFNILYVQVGLNTILPANFSISVRIMVAQHYLTCELLYSSTHDGGSTLSYLLTIFNLLALQVGLNTILPLQFNVFYTPNLLILYYPCYLIFFTLFIIYNNSY